MERKQPSPWCLLVNLYGGKQATVTTCFHASRDLLVRHNYVLVTHNHRINVSIDEVLGQGRTAVGVRAKITTRRIQTASGGKKTTPARPKQ